MAIELFSPGIQYYADRIQSGEPFSFPRYGDGEWMSVVDGIPFRAMRRPAHWPIWHTPEALGALTRSLTHCHLHESYWPAAWHLEYFRHKGKLRTLENWIRSNVPLVRWHDARVWRTATEEGNLYPLIQALKNCPLPVVLVGPWWLERLAGRAGMPIAKHVKTRRGKAILDKQKITNQILGFGQPAFIGFSVACLSKMLIHELWPVLGGKSFLVDFGALWDVHCGIRSRPFHGTLNRRTIRKNLRGK